MADRTPTVWKVKRGIYVACEFGQVEVSTNDTITVGSLDSAQNPLEAHVFKMSDGSTVTCTHAGGDNVITITAAGLTNEQCIYIAYGYKA